MIEIISYAFLCFIGALIGFFIMNPSNIFNAPMPYPLLFISVLALVCLVLSIMKYFLIDHK